MTKLRPGQKVRISRSARGHDLWLSAFDFLIGEIGDVISADDDGVAVIIRGITRYFPQLALDIVDDDFCGPLAEW